MIAALYVEPAGIYIGVPDVDPWDEARDARTYSGPHPVVAHPPCQRWGRFWHGSTRKPHQYKLGDDGGCFAACLTSVRQWGGLLEHPWVMGVLNKPFSPEALLKALAHFPDAVQSAAQKLEPHIIATYLRELAGYYHSYYNAHKILVDDAALCHARIALSLATRQVILNGLNLLGVSAPETM